MLPIQLEQISRGPSFCWRIVGIIERSAIPHQCPLAPVIFGIEIDQHSRQFSTLQFGAHCQRVLNQEVKFINAILRRG
jgi:hypothetical protein